MSEKFYHIEKCDSDLSKPKELISLLEAPTTSEILAKVEERYLSWEEFRKKSWATPDPKQLWSLIRLQRRVGALQTPVKDSQGRTFTYNAQPYLEFLHQVDLELGGNFVGVNDFSENDRKRIIRRNLIEESIASSQLEGANTSRSVAKKMLQEGRSPRDHGEQMIVNNHQTMQWIEQELKDEDLTYDLLMELHRRVTKDTLDINFQGVLRKTLNEKGERLKVIPWDHETVAYITPDRDFVEQQLPALLNFANGKNDLVFIHPLIRSIILHFWIGLLHPFEDGNGRIARVLFFWSMLRRGYWAFSYLSLSERIKKSPSQYAMAYVNSEQDENDLNYFIHYNIKKLQLARSHLEEYVRRKVRENRQISSIIQRGYNFSRRQINLLQYLAKDEQRFTSIGEHQNVNTGISQLTAINDLKKLVHDGFLRKVRNGRNMYYYPTEKIRELFRG